MDAMSGRPIAKQKSGLRRWRVAQELRELRRMHCHAHLQLLAVPVLFLHAGALQAARADEECPHEDKEQCIYGSGAYHLSCYTVGG